MDAPAASKDALAGIRVLDFSIMLAGPYCCRMLADMGADVVKIEPPEGDDMRPRPPIRSGFSTYFGQLNAGKQSLALDLKKAESIELIKKLVLEADVLVENFRPGVMQRLGLDFQTLAAINPGLIYCSISGYGQTGPLANKAAYAMIVQAESGFDHSLMRYAGDRDRPASGAVFAADVLGGIFAYAAIQTALVQRARTGKGQRLDVSLMESMLNLLVYEMQEAQFPVPNPRASYGPVRAKDRDLLVAPLSQRNFEAMCEVSGQAELRNDPRFATTVARSANWKAMMDIVEQWTAQHSAAHCIAALDAAGVPCGLYRNPGEALQDEQLQQRGTFTPVNDGAGQFLGVNVPWKMSGAETRIRDRVPKIGEHGAAILRRWLGT